MAKIKLDKATEKVFTQGEHLKSMTGSTGWAIAREMLLKKIATLLNMADISELNPQTIVQVIGIRQETAKALLGWLKEIEGTVEQHNSNISSYSEVDDSYIINLDDLK